MNEDYCFDEALFAQVDSNRKVSESNFGKGKMGSIIKKTFCNYRII